MSELNTKTTAIELASESIMKKMSIRLDKKPTSDSFRSELAKTINEVAEMYCIKPMALNRIFL
jgi:hypothetical protein